MKQFPRDGQWQVLRSTINYIDYLWFDTQAEEAANFYISLFKNSKMLSLSRYDEGMLMPAGTGMTMAFHLKGQKFVALNGGPRYKFTEAISLFVNCEMQEEVDFL